MILCEGYMDVIAVHAAGQANAVATLGTAITAEQARIMARYTKEVIIAYDMDDAGRRAAEKAIHLLDGVGVRTKILKLNGAKDPDEFIRKFGADAFRLRLDDSENQFDYRCSTVIASHDLEDFNDRMACIAELTALLATLHTDVERDVYIGRISEKLGVSRESLKNDVLRARKRNERSREKEETRRQIQQTAGYGDRINPDRAKYRRAAAAEESILGILLLYPELLPEVAEESGLALHETEFLTEFNRRVFAFLLQCAEVHGHYDSAYLGEVFTDEEIGRIMGMQVARTALTQNDMSVIRDNVAVLRSEGARERQKIGEMSTDDLMDLIKGRRDSKT
jgi:DNA primase